MSFLHFGEDWGVFIHFNFQAPVSNLWCEIFISMGG
jgi:hypothetical protein